MRPLAQVLLTLALVALAARAQAAPFAPPAPPAGVVAPGEIVVTALPALPAGTYECELFLLPEGGAPIRVSAELPAGAREVRWRMPAIAARRARLVLRAGGEHDERESAPSRPFALAQLPASELSRLLRGRSEAGERLESCAGAASAGLGEAPHAPSLSAGLAPACASESSAPQLEAPCESERSDLEAVVPESCPATSRLPRPNSPARTPLRN